MTISKDRIHQGNRRTRAHQVRQQRGSPQRIQVDNGPEFVSMVLDRWAYEGDQINLAALIVRA